MDIHLFFIITQMLSAAQNPSPSVRDILSWIFLPQRKDVRTRPSSLIVMIVTARRIIASFNQARTLWLWTADIYSWCFTEMDTDVVIKRGKRFTDVQTVRGTKSFLVRAANSFSKHTWRRERTDFAFILTWHLGVAKEVLWALYRAAVDSYLGLTFGLLQMWSVILVSMFPFKKSVILNHGCTKDAFSSCDCFNAGWIAVSKGTLEAAFGIFGDSHFSQL